MGAVGVIGIARLQAGFEEPAFAHRVDGRLPRHEGAHGIRLQPLGQLHTLTRLHIFCRCDSEPNRKGDGDSHARCRVAPG